MLYPEEAGAGGGAPADEPANPNPADEPAADDKGEGTTPEEVKSVLKNSGMDLPDEPKPADPADDDEEGDDPDKPAAGADDAKPVDEPADDEEVPDKPAKPTAPADDTNAEDKYSFQVEDANGVTFKISADANIEDVLAEFQPKNNGQIIAVLDQLRDVKAQKATDDAKAAEDIAKAERTERATEIRTGWDAEAKALQGSKRIPEGADGETRINEVFKFMADENTKRIDANQPTLNSFEDALDKLENKEARDAKDKADKADKIKARENGGKVGGSSAAASSGPPIYKAGSARNSNEALRSMGLLPK